MNRFDFVAGRVGALTGPYGTVGEGTWFRKLRTDTEYEELKRYRLVERKNHRGNLQFALQPWHPREDRMIKKLVWINIKKDVGYHWLFDNYTNADEPDKIHI